MSVVQFDTSLPSIRQVQNLIKEASALEFKLVTGDQLFGRILWQDSDCICLADDNKQQTIIWRQAIAYMRIKE